VLGSHVKGFKTSGFDAVRKACATFYYDMTNTVEPSPVKAVQALAPPSHILFGTDYPYGDGGSMTGDFVVEMRANLNKVGLTGAQVGAVGHGNAHALFPRLATTQTAKRA